MQAAMPYVDRRGTLTSTSLSVPLIYHPHVLPGSPHHCSNGPYPLPSETTNLVPTVIQTLSSPHPPQYSTTPPT
eukprot:766336-Hanusia_phi.AAC.2